MRFVARAFALGLLATVLIAPAAVFAAAKTENGITISPVQKELVVSSGLVEATTTVELTNNSGKNLVGTVRLLDFKTLDETSGLLFSQAGIPSSKYGLATWMTLVNGETVNVLNGKTTLIPVHISNRADLAPGGHYGAVVITLGTTGQQAPSQASFKQELVSLILVNKLGGADYGLLLESMKVDRGGDMPGTAIFRFRAGGNTHVTPRGYVTVTDSHGTLIEKGIINIESTTILPGTSRQMISLLEPTSKTHAAGRLKLTAFYRNDEQTSFTQQSMYLDSSHWQSIVIATIALTGVTGGLLWFTMRRTPVARGRFRFRKSV
jgi:hypothetical protein